MASFVLGFDWANQREVLRRLRKPSESYAINTAIHASSCALYHFRISEAMIFADMIFAAGLNMILNQACPLIELDHHNSIRGTSGTDREEQEQTTLGGVEEVWFTVKTASDFVNRPLIVLTITPM